MEEIAGVLRQFHQALRLEGFSEQEAFALTTTYLVSLLRMGTTGEAAKAAELGI